ncbi:MAG: hypothetical protein GKR89_30365 [Candidatus Latescibacteria bacterium]|nr:hypothetical protein [Candidatus Latescibacterota bacterium]
MSSGFKTSLLAGSLIAGLAGCSAQDPVSPGAAAKLTVSGAPAGGQAEVDRGRPVAGDKPVQALEVHEQRFDQVLEVGDLRLEWLAVEDSRCPEGVDCVWEGQVQVSLGVSREDEDLGAFDIVLHAGDEEEARIEIGPHAIGLVAVEPYPVFGVETTRQDYVAKLVVGPAPRIPGGGGLVVSNKPPRPLPPELEGEKPVLGGEPIDDRKPVPEEIAAALSRNRQQWQELGLRDYRFTFQRICFCLRDYTREVVLEVRDGTIASAHYADTGEEVVDQGQLESYRTIDGLFDFLAEAVAERAVQIDAEYDAAQGFPTSIYVDFDRRIADEETGFGARDVEAISD